MSASLRDPRSWRVLPEFSRGGVYADSLQDQPVASDRRPDEPPNPLWDFFVNRDEGPGIWKWEHYFEVYQRHLRQFVGEPVDLLEIGIFSGGSLDMWADYFGTECHVHGVDIDPSCTNYERENVSVYVGDQEDRTFWAQVKRKVRAFDIVIDDGGHTTEQQIVTLEEVLPHLRPGGVYIGEDVHGTMNRFTAFAAGLVTRLNEDVGDWNAMEPTSFQRSVHSIHFYPYLVVIEKRLAPPSRFTCARHGTEWNPIPMRPE
ncbi:MAG TPA: class I SAM-dependent methyltransferase [Acidimicrobiia bacterium]